MKDLGLLYSNLPWYVCMMKIATNVTYAKVFVIVAETYTTFKDNGNI